MLLSQLSNVGVEGCRHLCCYLASKEGENSVGDFCHYVVDFVNNGVVDGLVELDNYAVESSIVGVVKLGNDVVREIIELSIIIMHDGLELVLELSRSRLLGRMGSISSILLVEELRG